MPSFASNCSAFRMATSRPATCNAAPLDGGAMEQPFGRGHSQQCFHLPAAARLAENHDRVRIAAKMPDVRAHPFERVHDVEHAVVAGCREVPAELAEVR